MMDSVTIKLSELGSVGGVSASERVMQNQMGVQMKPCSWK